MDGAGRLQGNQCSDCDCGWNGHCRGISAVTRLWLEWLLQGNQCSNCDFGWNGHCRGINAVTVTVAGLATAGETVQ